MREVFGSIPAKLRSVVPDDAQLRWHLWGQMWTVWPWYPWWRAGVGGMADAASTPAFCAQGIDFGDASLSAGCARMDPAPLLAPFIHEPADGGVRAAESHRPEPDCIPHGSMQTRNY